MTTHINRLGTIKENILLVEEDFQWYVSLFFYQVVGKNLK